MQITRTNPVTKELVTKELDVTVEELEAWAKGGLIQDAMPRLSPEDREFILTGHTAESWAALFPPEEE